MWVCQLSGIDTYIGLLGFDTRGYDTHSNEKDNCPRHAQQREWTKALCGSGHCDATARDQCTLIGAAPISPRAAAAAHVWGGVWGGREEMC